MIYKLHYWFFASGANVFSILIGVFIETYTDASSFELGTLLMVIPFLSMMFRPIICSMADRSQEHRKYLILCLLVIAISYSPFVIIPFLGESVYKEHARLCWYLFIGLKVIGDVAFGGVASIGDSLAINYAKRIGTSFTVYRVWGTISWMFFGLVIGQINEVDFLPKYVPAFMVLISASLLNMFFIWLWPYEYFRMSDSALVEPDSEKQTNGGGGTGGDGGDERGASDAKKQKKKSNALTKSLMPKEVVWAQAKRKLLGLFGCGSCCGNESSRRDVEGTISAPPSATNEEQVKNDEQQQQQRQQSSDSISKRTQLTILAILLRRDVRIALYWMYFVTGGCIMATMSFFYISLSNICHAQGTCNFSQLAGYLQVSMASLETVLFIYVGGIMAKIGRLNMAAVGMFFASAKFLFYGTIWTQVSPYYSILVEGLCGLVYGTYLTLMVETGHLFSSEVQFIIPELLERKIITAETDTNKLKYSLAATMQALISSAFDGFGRGIGALIYGFLLERISYETLWLIIGITCSSLLVILLVMNLIGTLLGIRLGLDVKNDDQIKAIKDLEQTESPSETTEDAPASAQSLKQ